MVDTSPAASRVYRALIVDDDHDARRLLERVLSKARVQLDIAVAADGQEAFDLVPEFRPHVVITDVMMPRMNGFELCTALRADPATKSLPIIMVTALDDDEQRARGLEAGANAYLTKPLSWKALVSHVQQLLNLVPEEVS